LIGLDIGICVTSNAYPLRYRVEKREKLDQDSDLLCDQIRTIDNQRIISDRLAELSMKELFEVDEQVRIVLGLR